MNESHDAAGGPDAPVARMRHAFLATLVSLIEWVGATPMKIANCFLLPMC
jgi:hypothetical protein